jgi:hypothetical protein
LFAPPGEEDGVYPVIKAKSFGRKMLATLGEVVLSPTAWRRRRRVSRLYMFQVGSKSIVLKEEYNMIFDTFRTPVYPYVNNTILGTRKRAEKR